ncbi:hypothetical protein BJ742DRAFT_379407 [Cladochytrium replicatum]|nr:hypothetical protein BJ742DRAFT_379407 [Cladochytrium replicatum]
MDQWVQKRAVALFAYNSGVDMDLVMDEGDPILVTGVENDEWWNGKNLSTKKFGSFPKEFVRLVPDPFAEAVGELAATTSSPTDVNSETNPFARDAPAATARSISQPESESAGTRFIMPAPETETRTVTERINPDGSRSIVTTITKKVLTTVTKPNTHSAQIPTPAATPPKVTTTAPKPPPKLTTTTTPGVRPPMPPRPVGHGTASSWAPTVDDVITRLESIKTVRAHGKDKLVWTPDQFVAIDLYCKNSPAGVNHDMDKLVNYLSAFPGEKTQLNKLRTVYAWVCTHIEYDVAGYLSGKFGGNDPLKTGTAVCAGYSKLFRDLSHALGVTEVIVIEGSGRGAGSAPGDPCIDPYDHAWNAVLLENGEHRFIESTWGATNLATRKFTYNFTNQWFLMKPKDFIYTHFPENPQYQYLESPISVDEYLSLPYMPDASAFDIHYKMIAPRGDSMLSVLDADPKTNEVYVEISVPIHTIDVDGFDVSASMFMPCQMLPPARPTVSRTDIFAKPQF